MKPPVRRIVLAALLAGAYASPSGAAPLQVTNSASDCSSTAPVSDGGGTLAAWQSDCDPAGTNADGSIEIFRATVGTAPVQLTNGSGCSSTRPSISTSGDRVAFESSCNLTGQNADGNVEIFLWKSGGSLTQLTISSGCDNLAPAISGNGNFVAFDSTCDIFGVGNGGRGSEIFRVSSSGTLEQMTADAVGDCDSTSASISSNGGTIAFDSDCNLGGQNEDRAIEIFTATVNPTTKAVTVTQMTQAPEDSCSSVRPSIDGAGSIIAFTSNCNFVGTNADGNDEIFTINSSKALAQVTNVGASGACASGEPHMSLQGNAISFSSYCKFGSSNGDQSVEAFQVGVGASKGGILAVSDGGGGCSSLAGGVSSDGTRVMLDSDCNLASNNADFSVEIFRATACVCGAPFSRDAKVNTSDALFVLRSAVGSSVCALCECDIDGNLKVSAGDALRTLKKAVGQDVPMVCPAG